MLAGIVKEGVISCPRHGWHYDLAGGASTDHPGYTMKTYQIEVVGDDIMIKLGLSPMKKCPSKGEDNARIDVREQNHR
jgi:Rieske Fe-S protein